MIRAPLPPLAILGARLLCPAQGLDEVGTIVVEGGRIASCGGDVAPPAGATLIDGEGLVVAPGLVDSRVFRVDAAPALRGGVTTLCLMPDQRLTLDDPALIERATRVDDGRVHVLPYAAATKDLAGQEMAEIGLCKAAGARAVATGRASIASALVMSRVLAYAAGLDLPVIAHAEEPSLTNGAVATDSEFATRMGLPAAPAHAEALMVARDLRLAEAAGARLHVAQATTAESLALIRAAKARGQPVTCGITPTHFLLNEISIGAWRSFARLSPPLRCEPDRLAVVEALRDGTIDMIASGHDPLTAEDKRLPFAQATPGAVGLETLLPLALTLAHDGVLDLAGVIALLTVNPASLLGSTAGTLVAGRPADLILFDAEAPWKITDASQLSTAKNTPFDGMPTMGEVLLTLCAGRPAHVHAELAGRVDGALAGHG